MATRATVTKVIDGDTFWTSKKIRLARVEAPELNAPNGQKAKQKLESLILNKSITYEQVGTSYDRIVAEIWLNGASINDMMIRFLETL
ncbi:MAG: thermonuclease family protein [Candidatus Omnitrophica bacterium]|nr:thermonuclease family protein [Candidatus Omnitrophota bacterium]MBU0974951.1 thermonuclease family protein [Patescibacteria group bacterium]